MDFNGTEISNKLIGHWIVNNVSLQCVMKNSDILEWQGEEFSLQLDSRNDISSCIWDDMYGNEDSLLSIFEEQTPMKDCLDYSNPFNNVLGYADKVLEACPETLQIKRRRMLQFTSEPNECEINNLQFTSAFLHDKSTEGLCMESGMYTYSESNPQYDGPSSNLEESDQEISDNLPINCVKDSEMHCSLNEMDDFMAIDDRILVEEDQYPLQEMRTDVPRKTPSPSPVKIIKGGKLTIKPSKKLVAPLMCPFALLKPCGVKGDITLKDINQKIQGPPPSSSELRTEENPSSSYPTSAFSGKPVVLKTKIRTLGGKGSITIMRTKG